MKIRERKSRSLSRFRLRPDFCYHESPAGRGRERFMADKKKVRRIGLRDRIRIQAALETGLPPSKIAEDTGFSKSAICREVNSRSTVRNPNGARCRNGLYVCNRCTKRAHCNRLKLFYDFAAADLRAEAMRRDPRSGRRLTDEQIGKLDSLVSPGVRLGQSVHHVFQSDPEIAEICSERTLRRAIYDGLLSVKPHDLRRYPRFRHRLGKGAGGKRLLVSDVRKLMGRMYQDFLDYMASHPAASSVQLDSVVGKAEGKKAILTITWPESSFQIGLLIDKGDPSSARKAILRVMRALCGAGVKGGFPMEACLSDNGTEFFDYWKVEGAMKALGVVARTFYARPMRSDDKAEAERNHEIVRYVFPKGKSLDGLTQADLDEAFSNINSYTRLSKGDKTPFELAEARFGRGFCDALNIRKVDKKKVRLLPAI